MWSVETSCTAIICIVCHHVLCQPSQHGTSSMRQHLVAKVHIAMLKKLTVSELTKLTSSNVKETAFSILKRHGSRGITIVSSQRNFIFDLLILSIFTELTDKMLQTGSERVSNCRISPWHTWNCYLMIGFVLAQIPWNAITNLELQRSKNTL